MDENELKALQAQLASEGGQPAVATDKEQEEKRAAEAAMKRDMLATVLDNGARERCQSRKAVFASNDLIMKISVSRIALVAPQRSAQIEGMLLRMAQTGQLRGRVTEQMLIGLLEQVCYPRFNGFVFFLGIEGNGVLGRG
jgi:DNA-binding TFAR19-related protein (PDSD5 family)